jgi:Putative beta barrel porin-7 (BBP7)
MRGLTLAAVMLSASSAVADTNDSDYFGYDQEAPLSAVGDLPGYSDDAYYAETANEAEANRTVTRTNYAAPAAKSVPARTVAASSQHYQPVAYDAIQPSYNDQVNFHQGGCGVESWGGGCDSDCNSGGCDGGPSCGCDSCGGGSLGRMMRGCDHTTWAMAEALLWFPQERSTVPLVSRSPGAGSNPALNVDGTSVFGASIGGDISGGLRTDFGKFIAPNIGFGGRFWAIGDNGSEFAAASNGATEAFGIPIFNTDPAGVGENSIIIAGTSGTGRTFSGDVNVSSDLEMWASEAYGRLRFSSCSNYTLDFIGGYTHFNIEDSLRMNSRRIFTNAGVGPTIGTINQFNDSFETENQFNGGQIGFESVLTRGRWMARSLTKVHLGNMNQRLNIAGSSSETVLGPPDTVTPFTRGIFAEGNATGERDVFTFAPEMNFKLAYRFRPNVLLSAGYSFIFWDNVALSGAQVDRNVNAANLLTNAPSSDPFRINDSSLYVHGLDLGVVLDF